MLIWMQVPSWLGVCKVSDNMLAAEARANNVYTAACRADDNMQVNEVLGLFLMQPRNL